MNGTDCRTSQGTAWRGVVRLLIPGWDPLEAIICDMSEMGWGLRVERALDADAEVVIDAAGFQGSGVIRFCYPFHGAFRAGVELRRPR
jgi:hypothetical protein